jgi:serine/threonine-protein kinase
MGVIAFQCLTGRRPFEGEVLGDLLLRICAEPIPVPSQLARVPPGFDAWFARATDRDPERRFQSAAELAEALRQICGLGTTAGATSLAPPASLPVPSMSLAPAPRAASPSHGAAVLVFGVFALFGAIAIAGLAVFWFVRADDAPPATAVESAAAAPAPTPTPTGSAPAAPEAEATDPVPRSKTGSRPTASRPTPTATAGSGQTPAEKIKAAEQKVKAAEEQIQAAEEKLKGLEGQ